MTSKKFEKSNTKATAAAKTANTVIIQQPQVLSVAVEISGTAPLIQNAFSQKAIEQMLRKHMGLNVTREKKNPRECIESATIRNTDGKVSVPPAGIKAAMLSASAQTKTFKKTQLRTQLYVEGQSIPIEFEEMKPRMDMVRTSGMTRTPDVRFRPSFLGWKARIVIQFSDSISVQSVIDLLSRAGSVGLGEWRPEKNGTFGTFIVTRNITTPKEIAEVREICSVPLVPITIPEWAMDADIDPELLQRIAGNDGAQEEELDETA